MCVTPEYYKTTATASKIWKVKSKTTSIKNPSTQTPSASPPSLDNSTSTQGPPSLDNAFDPEYLKTKAASFASSTGPVPTPTSAPQSCTENTYSTTTTT